MFLFWNSTERGQVWVQERAVRTLLEDALPESMHCREIVLWGDRDLAVLRMTYPAGEIAPENLRYVSERLQQQLAPVADNVEVTWLEEVASEPAEQPAWRRILANPLYWGLGVGLLVGIGHLGPRGIFRTIMAGLAAWVVALLATPAGRYDLRALIARYRK
ncbi:MAG: hypothetical protein K9L28_09170 [Synergistales bacterium]|nr:hypothetical protein [Synergistales bacterium]